MIVVDASALIEVLVAAPGSDKIRDRLFSEGESLHAPHLLDGEIAHVLRRLCFSGGLDEERAEQALETLMALPINRHSHAELLGRNWGMRHNVSAYDAAYVALAEALDAPLVTHDQALAGSSGHSVSIEVL